jgi:hypothetical protein
MTPVTQVPCGGAKGRSFLLAKQQPTSQMRAAWQPFTASRPGVRCSATVTTEKLFNDLDLACDDYRRAPTQFVSVGCLVRLSGSQAH